MYAPNHPYFQQLEQRIRYLEYEHEKLKQRLDELNPVHVENMNYKVQELHVKELKGTLNIGMTGISDPEELKKWLADSSSGEDVDIQMSDMDHQSAAVDATQQSPDTDQDVYGYNPEKGSDES